MNKVELTWKDLQDILKGGVGNLQNTHSRPLLYRGLAPGASTDAQVPYIKNGIAEYCTIYPHLQLTSFIDFIHVYIFFIGPGHVTI